MECRVPIYSILLLLWLGPYAFIFFELDGSKAPSDTTASERRLLKLCFRGFIAILAMVLLVWWVQR